LARCFSAHDVCRYRPTQREDKSALTPAILTLAGQYGRYGDLKITRFSSRGASGQGPGGADLAA
jgi:hypothetical protein